MTSNKSLWMALIVVAIIAVLGLVFPRLGSQIVSFGGVTNYDELDATALKIGGTNGSRVGPVIATTCTLLANNTIAATSTGPVDCAVTGVVAGDVVFASLATTTATGAFNTANYIVASAMASTTSGFVTLRIYNGTGASAIPAATSGVGSSTQILVFHPVSTVPGL